MVRFQSVELTERLQQKDATLQQQDTTLQQQDTSLQDGTHDTAAGSSYDAYNNNKNNKNNTILPPVIGGVAYEKENLPSGMDSVGCGGQMESVS